MGAITLVSQATGSTTVNLTTTTGSAGQALEDWARFTNASSTNNWQQRRSGGGSLISNVTATGTSPESYNDDNRTISYTDGTPTGSLSNQDGMYWIIDSGDSFSFTVPAGTGARQLRIYASVFALNSRFTLSLSDASASPVAATVNQAGYEQYTIVFDYEADSASQTATMTIDATGLYGGNVAIQAVWLSTESGGGATDYPLDAQAGSYSITGVNATLVADRSLNAETGAYSVTGVSASIVADRAINAEIGSYSITGVNGTLIADRSINAETGAYSVTGLESELLFEEPAGVYTLNAEPGSYEITGIDVGFDAPSRASETSGGVRGSFYRNRRIIIERVEEEEEEQEVIRKVKRLVARKITNKQIAQKVQTEVIEAVQYQHIDLTQAQNLIDALKQQEILARVRARQLKDDEEAILLFL